MLTSVICDDPTKLLLNGVAEGISSWARMKLEWRVSQCGEVSRVLVGASPALQLCDMILLAEDVVCDMRYPCDMR